MDYIKGLLFIVLSISILNQLGKKISKNNIFHVNLLIGYVVYVFFQALGGMYVQYFKVDYQFYKIYMVILVLGILLYTLWGKKIQNRNIKKLLVNHFQEYAILYLIGIVLLGFSLLNTKYLWFGNHQDDGWYLLKVSLAPYLGDNYNIQYASGFNTSIGLSRIINTFELDFAFWSNILNIYPTIFCKVIMAFFNYFLILNGFYAVIKQFNNNYDYNKVMPYLLLSLMFFALMPETMVNHGILFQNDAWHFNTAIWYGSAFVRCLGPILLIFPFLISEKFELKNIICFCISSLVLLSKASQALPLIFVIALAILSYYFCLWIKERKRFALIGFLSLILVLVFFPKANTELFTATNNLIIQLFKSKIVFLSFLIIIIIPFLLKNKKMYFWSFVLCTILIYIALPPVNAAFIRLSMFDFVIGRTISAFSFYLILTAGIYIGFLLLLINKKTIVKLIYSSFMCLIIVVFIGSLLINVGYDHSFKLLKENPYLIPTTTIKLSDELENIASEVTAKLYTIVPSWVSQDGWNHSLGIFLRINAPNVYSIGALPRFPGDLDRSVFNAFTQGEQMIFDKFNDNPESEENQNVLRNLLTKFPINSIVVSNAKARDVLITKFDYHFKKMINGEINYYILMNNKIYNE